MLDCFIGLILQVGALGVPVWLPWQHDTVCHQGRRGGCGELTEQACILTTVVGHHVNECLAAVHAAIHSLWSLTSLELWIKVWLFVEIQSVKPPIPSHPLSQLSTVLYFKSLISLFSTVKQPRLGQEKNL